MSFGRQTQTNKQNQNQQQNSASGMQAAQNAFRSGGIKKPEPTEPLYKLILMAF